MKKEELLTMLSVIFICLGFAVVYNSSIIGIQTMNTTTVSAFMNNDEIIVYKPIVSTSIDGGTTMTYYTYALSEGVYVVKRTGAFYVESKSLPFNSKDITLFDDNGGTVVFHKGNTIIATRPIASIYSDGAAFTSTKIVMLVHNMTGDIIGIVIMLVAIVFAVLGKW